MEEYRSLLETTENTRDLGGYRVELPSRLYSAADCVSDEKNTSRFADVIMACSHLAEIDAVMKNSTSIETADRDIRYTKRDVILRSDVPTHPSKRDIDFLLQHRITTIIDLRGEKEARTTPNPLSAIESFHYYNVPLDDGVVPDSPEAVPMIYMQFTEAENMRQVFAHIAAAEDGVLFHCSAGKDRTGVVAAILLLLAGVSREDIVADHVLTREYVHERFARFFEEHPEIDRTIVIPRESYMNGFLDRFLARNCSEMGVMAAENYLRKIGLREKEIERIKRKLLI